MEGIVVTKNYYWLFNCIKSIANNGANTEIDYWTNHWLPDRDVDRISVYYNKNLIFSGSYTSSVKKNQKQYLLANDVYKINRLNLNSIGISQNDTVDKFIKDIIPISFTPTSSLGNIWISIDEVSRQGLMLLDEHLKKIKWCNNTIKENEYNDCCKKIIDNINIKDVYNELSDEEYSKISEGSRRIIYR